VIESIKNKMPVQIGVIKKGETYGHSLVVDGYRESDGRFHINLGWSGQEEDTWYNIPNITSPPSLYSYDVVHTVVYDICPYQGWNQWGADEKNSFGTVYTYPTKEAELK